MATAPPTASHDRSTIERWGRTAWMLIGIALAAAIGYSALATLSGLVVPLILAAVIGMLAVPLIDRLERWRVPRQLGALVFIIAFLGALVGSIALAVNGVIDQSDEIRRFLTAGVARVDQWLTDLDLDLGVPEDRVDQARDVGLDLVPGLASLFSGVFSGAVSFLAGAFLGLFLLYFILADWEQLRDWVGGHLSSDADLGAGIVEDAISTTRGGFAALTVSSLVTAVLIGGTMLALDLPLAFAVALVTFVTSYIPYLGAIFSAMFACLVALGSGDVTQALILLVVILITQNVVQTIVATKLQSEKLRLHPIAGLVSTIVGAALAGLLGATLSAPVLATIIRVNRRLRDRNTPGTEPADLGLADEHPT